MDEKAILMGKETPSTMYTCMYIHYMGHCKAERLAPLHYHTTLQFGIVWGEKCTVHGSITWGLV